MSEERFLDRVEEIVGIEKIPPRLIFNMDQTSVKLQNVYKKTLSPIGAKQVTVIQPPAGLECLTVALLIGADGHKFPATIMFKGNKKTGQLSQKILDKLVVPDNVRLYSTGSGWWNAVFDVKWLRGSFDKSHRGGCLIRDQATVHCKEASRALLERRGIDQVFIPTGMTGKYQPLNVGVNFPFKCYLKQSYHEWRDSRTDKDITKKGYLKKPSRQDFIDFVSAAWDKISATTVENSFVGAQILPEPLYMLASDDDSEDLDNIETLDSSFEHSFSSVEDSFVEEEI